jgi:hypothetical protein
LPDINDRDLIAHAVAFRCDAFCTRDRRSIYNKRNTLHALPLRILTPAAVGRTLVLACKVDLSSRNLSDCYWQIEINPVSDLVAKLCECSASNRNIVKSTNEMVVGRGGRTERKVSTTRYVVISSLVLDPEGVASYSESGLDGIQRMFVRKLVTPAPR